MSHGLADAFQSVIGVHQCILCHIGRGLLHACLEDLPVVFSGALVLKNMAQITIRVVIELLDLT